MKRRFFKLPPRTVFESMADSGHRHERAAVIRRTQFIFKLFGPPRGMIFAGVMTADLYYEMLNSYIYGLYLSTIFTAHALAESRLAFDYAIGSKDNIAEGGLAKLVAECRKNKQLSEGLCSKLDMLRAMRVAYFHSHVGLNKRSAMNRYLNNEAHGHRQHMVDAKEALLIVRELIAEMSPSFFTSRTGVL